MPRVAAGDGVQNALVRNFLVNTILGRASIPDRFNPFCPGNRLLIQIIRTFCYCTVCTVVLDAEKIDQSWSTYSLSRR
jgi:hypothetical protein